jgi:hypothetical protein
MMMEEHVPKEQPLDPAVCRHMSRSRIYYWEIKLEERYIAEKNGDGTSYEQQDVLCESLDKACDATTIGILGGDRNAPDERDIVEDQRHAVTFMATEEADAAVEDCFEGLSAESAAHARRLVAELDVALGVTVADLLASFPMGDTAMPFDSPRKVVLNRFQSFAEKARRMAIDRIEELGLNETDRVKDELIRLLRTSRETLMVEARRSKLVKAASRDPFEAEREPDSDDDEVC